jgi:hypothetical protein
VVWFVVVVVVCCCCGALVGMGYLYLQLLGVAEARISRE